MSTQGPSARGSFAHRELGSTARPNTAIPATTTLSVVIPCAGATAVRFRGKVTGAVTSFKPEFLRPNGTTVYAAGQPAPTATVAGTEFSIDVPCKGESRIKVSIVGHATIDTVLNFLDCMALTGS